MNAICQCKHWPWFVEPSVFFWFWSSVSSLGFWLLVVLENCFRTKYGTNSPRIDEMDLREKKRKDSKKVLKFVTLIPYEGCHKSRSSNKVDQTELRCYFQVYVNLEVISPILIYFSSSLHCVVLSVPLNHHPPFTFSLLLSFKREIRISIWMTAEKQQLLCPFLSLSKRQKEHGGERKRNREKTWKKVQEKTWRKKLVI